MSSKTKSTATKEEATSALVPKLRFPEFRGKEGWTEKPLKAAAHINPGNDGLPESFIYIDLESVEAGNLKAKNRISREGSPSRAQRLVEHGDIIFQVVRPYQRNNLLCEFDDDDDYVASTGYAQLRAKGSNRFLYQSIHTDSFVGRVMAKCTGSNYPAINSSDLADIQLPLPATLPEQQKIAECLSSVDELIAAQARKVDALKTHKKGLMQQLLPREGETQPRLRFPEFKDAGEWKRRKISSLLARVVSPVCVESEEMYREIGIRSHGKGIFHKEPVLGKALGDKRVFRVEERAFVLNIVFAWEQAVAVTSMAEKEMVASQRFPMYKPIERESNIDFIKYFFLTNKGKELLGIASPGGAGRNKTLGQKEFEKLELLCPANVEEQTAIAHSLSSADALVTTESQKLEALKTHKKGLMQQLFPSPEAVEA